MSDLDEMLAMIEEADVDFLVVAVPQFAEKMAQNALACRDPECWKCKGMKAAWDAASKRLAALLKSEPAPRGAGPGETSAAL